MEIKNNTIGIIGANVKFECVRCESSMVVGFLPISHGSNHSYSLAPYCIKCLKICIK